MRGGRQRGGCVLGGNGTKQPLGTLSPQLACKSAPSLSQPAAFSSRWSFTRAARLRSIYHTPLCSFSPVTSQGAETQRQDRSAAPRSLIFSLRSKPLSKQPRSQPSSPEDAHRASEMSLGRLVAPSRAPLAVPPPVATRELLVGRARSRLSRLSELPCQLGKRGEINDCLGSQFSSAPAGGQAS